VITTRCCPKCGEPRFDTPGKHFLCADWTPVEQGVPKHMTQIPPEYWGWTEEEQWAFLEPMVRALKGEATP
jgi:hypothetical protein